MIGSAYAQAGSLVNLEFYSINSPEVINKSTPDFQTSVSMDVEVFNFSDEGNLTYEWSDDFDGQLGSVTIQSPNSKETLVRFGGGSGLSIGGNIFCKVTDSGLPSEYTSVTQFSVDFQ